MVDHQIRDEAKPPSSLYSPIQHLPPEIISYIFTLLDFPKSFNTESEDHPRSNKKNRTLTPFILGAVCQDWKAIAWSTPVLWSSIVLRLTDPTISKMRCSQVRDWLARSGQLPLSIHISVDFMPHISLEAKAEIISLADIINHYSARWFHFELFCPNNVAKYFRAEGSHAPILESLRLQMPGRPSKIDFVNCPRLQKVHLVSTLLTSVRWDNLTHIFMENMFYEDYLKIFRSTPLLVHAQAMGVRKPQFQQSDQIVSPLKSLQVAGTDSLALLRDITCPALDELTVDSWSSYYHNEDCIISFLADSGQLRSLTILKCTLDSPGFIDVLRATPSLTKLVLSIVSSSSTTVNILDVLGMILLSQSSHSQPRFLSHLESFEYKGPFSYAPINSWPPAATAIRIPLHFAKFKFRTVTYISREATSFFLSLMERGITVDVCSIKGDNILQSSLDYYNKTRDWIDKVDMI